MNQQFKRITALCLFMALVFGLFGNVPFPKAIAVETEPGATTETGTSENLLANPGFEASLENWKVTGTGSIVESAAEPENVFSGNYALKITKTTSDAGVSSGSVVSSQITDIVPSHTYRLSAYVKESYMGGSGWQLYIQFYNSEGRRVAPFYVTSPSTGDWSYIDVTGTAPSDASYATILLTYGAGKESIYIDDLCFVDEGVAEWAPEAVDLQWDQVYSDYPRLDFDAERLEKIIEENRQAK